MAAIGLGKQELVRRGTGAKVVITGATRDAWRLCSVARAERAMTRGHEAALGRRDSRHQPTSRHGKERRIAQGSEIRPSSTSRVSLNARQSRPTPVGGTKRSWRSSR